MTLLQIIKLKLHQVDFFVYFMECLGAARIWDGNLNHSVKDQIKQIALRTYFKNYFSLIALHVLHTGQNI